MYLRTPSSAETTAGASIVDSTLWPQDGQKSEPGGSGLWHLVQS